MSANCQLCSSLLTETTCFTLSLDLSALKDTCSSLSSRLKFICKLKGINLPRLSFPTWDWASMTEQVWTRISFSSRKHGFGEYNLPKPCTLPYILHSPFPLCAMYHIHGVGWRALKKSYSHHFYYWHLHQPCMCGAFDLELDCRVFSVLTLTLEHHISLCFEISCEGHVISPWCDQSTILI